MGIKDLWPILSPFCERKPLYELQGKKVAIDLSGWVCEAQNITEYTVQPRMYLRNLYFRTCYLLLMDVHVVFVLDGRAPELKYKTILARNALQFKGAKPKTEVKEKKGKDRSRFNYTLKQCEEMLKLMGISCIKGEGEAEALCAHLNEDGLIDGIISQDSDCFAYGAHTVYRNFSISQQGPHAAKGGSIDVYSIKKSTKNMGIGRNKIIALALLCGSDYNDGVYGVGKDSVLKLFTRLDETKILSKLRTWRNEDVFYNELERKVEDKNICTSCGHPGKLQGHSTKGCLQCGSTRGCNTDYKNERVNIKNEINIRKKALNDPEFPDENLINEFLVRKDNVSKLGLKWNKPDLIKFVQFTVKYLTWEEIYGFEKIFPILTRWQIIHPDEAKNETGIVTPKFIKKERKPKGNLCYEIIWENSKGEFDDVIPKDQLSSIDVEKLWSTIEPQNLVKQAYPKLVEDFESTRKKPVSRKPKKSKAIAEISDLLENISISEPVPTKKKPFKPKKIQKVMEFTLDSSTPKKPSSSIDFDMSNFGDEDDCNVSDIVNDIIDRSLPVYTNENLEKFGVNHCSFFVNQVTEGDLFEKTFLECDSQEEHSD